MESHLRFPSGQIIEVSGRLLSSRHVFGIELPDSPSAPSDTQFATTLLTAAQRTSDHRQGAQKALRAANLFAQNNEPERSLIALAAYAAHTADIDTDADIVINKLGTLVDTMSLVHSALPYCHPATAAQLTQILAGLTEAAFRATALIEPFSLTIAKDDTQIALNTAAVVWGPELEDLIHDLEQTFNDLLLSLSDLDNRGRSVQPLEKVIQELRALGLRVSGKVSGRKTMLNRLEIIQTLLASWSEAAHRLLLIRSSHNQVGNEDKDAGSQVAEIEAVIEQVETALRALITQKYCQQYGDSWPQHIAAKHPKMHSYWMRNMEHDQATFRTYQGHRPQLLEYARLEDLKELITVQWHLFRGIFDFGQEDRNKMIFSEKMEQITRVRNPLAHHRSIPQNELLRAKVLCTDILLAIEGSKE